MKVLLRETIDPRALPAVERAFNNGPPVEDANRNQAARRIRHFGSWLAQVDSAASYSYHT
jgi:hypothetical protein